jgi:hypothetical protein
MTKESNGKAKRYNKPQPKKTAKKVAHATPNVAEELQNVIKIVKYNANIKRHTALNILNTFVEDGFIPDTKGAFVDFQWDKYTVKHSGITKEYQYDKTFVKALVKAHEDVAKDSAIAINTFAKFAGID